MTPSRTALLAASGAALVALAAPGAARAEIGLRDSFDAHRNAEGAGAAARPGTGVHEDNLRLQRQVEQLRESVRALTESLAVAHRESELHQESLREVRLRLEALGLEALDGDKGKLEQRLLHAVNDLRLERERSERLEVQIENLLAALQPLLQRCESVEPAVRSAVEAEIRAAAQMAAGGPGTPPGGERQPGGIRDGRVISVKQEWALVVANVGRRHGVKLGMPLRVLREGRPLAGVRVIDVRDSISGAVIQNQVSEKEPVRVGDSLRIDAKP